MCIRDREIAQHQGYRPSPENQNLSVPFYRVQARAIATKVHRDLPPTKFWSFSSSTPGPTFETRSGEPLLVEWVNALPSEHFLPMDHTVHGAEADKPTVRTVVHLHGAKTRPESDGYPEDWIVPGKSSLYFYPNQQDAAMLWYHDHALGINRLNVYAGLLGAFFVRDGVEEALNLPKGKYELPLILYDRLLTREGQLLYPVSPDPQAAWVPEIFGNAILVNGKLFPYLDVEPRSCLLYTSLQRPRVFARKARRARAVDQESCGRRNRDRESCGLNLAEKDTIRHTGSLFRLEYCSPVKSRRAKRYDLSLIHI